MLALNRKIASILEDEPANSDQRRSNTNSKELLAKRSSVQSAERKSSAARGHVCERGRGRSHGRIYRSPTRRGQDRTSGISNLYSSHHLQYHPSSGWLKQNSPCCRTVFEKEYLKNYWGAGTIAVHWQFGNNLLSL